MYYKINRETKEHSPYKGRHTESEYLVEADADGWIEWHGGECPLPDGVAYQVNVHGSVSVIGNKASEWHWDQGCGITAYRPILEEPKPTQRREPEKGSLWFVEGEDGGEVEFVTTIDGKALVRCCVTGYFYGHTIAFDELKPIPTPEKIAEERAVEAIKEAVDVWCGGFTDKTLDAIAGVTYAAIREGLIPGVKLESQ